MKIQELDEWLKEKLHVGKNYDIVRRTLNIGDCQVVIYYLTTLIGEENVTNMLIALNLLKSSEQIKTRLPNSTISEGNDRQKILDDVFSGISIILTCSGVYHVDVRFYPSRSISEPITEKTIRGSRDGFVETLNVNIGLIRRRIKSPHLMIESFDVSKSSLMKVSILYMDNFVDKKVLNKLKDKLSNIKVESLIMSDRALEELVFEQNRSPYPLVRYTERPDVASINLMNGKIIIIVDTSSSVIITPSTIIDHIRHVEEFRHSPIVGTFTRLIRTIAIFLGVFLLPLWLTLVIPSSIHNVFDITLSSDVSFKLLIIQVLIIELIFEIIRIASIHTPNHLTSAISLVAAVILGQLSLELGLFLPEIILLSAISTILGFATPSYELSMANKIYKIILIIIIGFFEKTGFLIAITVHFMYMLTIKVFDIPYLYPICPFNFKKCRNIFFRPLAKKKKRL